MCIFKQNKSASYENEFSKQSLKKEQLCTYQRYYVLLYIRLDNISFSIIISGKQSDLRILCTRSHSYLCKAL